MKLPRPKKHFGQNFLQDEEILNLIIETAQLNNSDEIIEIGPGLGALTQKLAPAVKHISAIEIDTQIIPHLQKKIKNFSNIEIHNQDVLTYKIPAAPYKLVANIPYYLTSPILRYFITESANHPQLAVLLVQKEVAQKICAIDQKHSVLSWQVQLFGKPEFIKTVPAQCFHPTPQVDSAILKITIFDKPLVTNPEKILNLIKICFTEKRKKLGKVLAKGLNLTSEEIRQKLESQGVDPNLRAEKLNINDWKKVSQII